MAQGAIQRATEARHPTRLNRSALFKHAAAVALGSPPEALNDRPLLLKKLFEAKLLVQAERRQQGFWRALRRRWTARIEGGGAEVLPQQQALLLQGAGHEDVRALQRAHGQVSISFDSLSEEVDHEDSWHI